MLADRNLNKNQFGKLNSLPDKIKFCLKHAVLAPSVHNTQPWLFKVGSDSCKIYFDPKLHLPKADPSGRNLYIGLGKCIENLVLAAKCYGLYKDLVYRLGDEPNLVAEVFFQEGQPDESLAPLVETILTRVNKRGLFLPKRVEQSILDDARKIYGQYVDGVSDVMFVTDQTKIEQIARLTEEGMHLAHGDRAFRLEMSDWINNNFSGRVEGMPGYSLRMPALLSIIIPFWMRFQDLGWMLGKLNYRSIASAPVLCFFTSKERTSLAWLKMGRGIERLSLEFQSQGLTTSIYIASVEMGELYKQTQQIIGSVDRPEFVFCLGYMNHRQKPTPKHSLEDKLIN